MKRMICFIMVFCVFFLLTGCKEPLGVEQSDFSEITSENFATDVESSNVSTLTLPGNPNEGYEIVGDPNLYLAYSKEEFNSLLKSWNVPWHFIPYEKISEVGEFGYFSSMCLAEFTSYFYYLLAGDEDFHLQIYTYPSELYLKGVENSHQLSPALQGVNLWRSDNKDRNYVVEVDGVYFYYSNGICGSVAWVLDGYTFELLLLSEMENFPEENEFFAKLFNSSTTKQTATGILRNS